MHNDGWYFHYCPYRFVESDKEILELRPNRTLRGICIALIVLGLAIIGGSGRVLTFDPDEARAARWLYGGGLVLLGWVLGSLKRIVLDKRCNVLTIARWPFRFRRFPLSSVTAVQVTHLPSSSRTLRRMPRPAADKLDLMLSGVGIPERIQLTFHSQPSKTRQMAMRIAEFLEVPIEGDLPQVNITPTPFSAGPRRLAASLCLVGACGTVLGFLALSLQQKERDEWDRTLRPVRARLIERNVIEWIEGQGNWYVRGVFELTVDGKPVPAEGNSTPDSFYQEKFGSSRKRVVPREVATPFAESWILNQTYDGFIHSDQPTHVFTEPVGSI